MAIEEMQERVDGVSLDASEARFSLRNVNLKPTDRIPFVVSSSYYNVAKNDKTALSDLQNKVKGLRRGTYENKASGYKADINARTINKIIMPAQGTNPYAKRYIDNLNAAIHLPELFSNAVYLDTKGNQKAKNKNKKHLEFHHFIAPLHMNQHDYRVRIVAREQANSDVLYIVETEIIQMKSGSPGPSINAPSFKGSSTNISISDLVNGVKIYDYQKQQNQVYSDKDLQYSISDTANESFVTLSPQRIDNLISEYAIPGNAESDYEPLYKPPFTGINSFFNYFK